MLYVKVQDIDDNPYQNQNVPMNLTTSWNMLMLLEIYMIFHVTMYVWSQMKYINVVWDSICNRNWKENAKQL